MTELHPGLAPSELRVSDLDGGYVAPDTHCAALTWGSPLIAQPSCMAGGTPTCCGLTPTLLDTIVDLLGSYVGGVAADELIRFAAWVAAAPASLLSGLLAAVGAAAAISLRRGNQVYASNDAHAQRTLLIRESVGERRLPAAGNSNRQQHAQTTALGFGHAVYQQQPTAQHGRPLQLHAAAAEPAGSAARRFALPPLPSVTLTAASTPAAATLSYAVGGGSRGWAVPVGEGQGAGRGSGSSVDALVQASILRMASYRNGSGAKSTLSSSDGNASSSSGTITVYSMDTEERTRVSQTQHDTTLLPRASTTNSSSSSSSYVVPSIADRPTGFRPVTGSAPDRGHSAQAVAAVPSVLATTVASAVTASYSTVVASGAPATEPSLIISVAGPIAAGTIAAGTGDGAVDAALSSGGSTAATGTAVASRHRKFEWSPSPTRTTPYPAPSAAYSSLSSSSAAAALTAASSTTATESSTAAASSFSCSSPSTIVASTSSVNSSDNRSCSDVVELSVGGGAGSPVRPHAAKRQRMSPPCDGSGAGAAPGGATGAATAASVLRASVVGLVTPLPLLQQHQEASGVGGKRGSRLAGLVSSGDGLPLTALASMHAPTSASSPSLRILPYAPDAATFAATAATSAATASLREDGVPSPPPAARGIGGASTGGQSSGDSRRLIDWASELQSFDEIMGHVGPHPLL